MGRGAGLLYVVVHSMRWVLTLLLLPLAAGCEERKKPPLEAASSVVAATVTPVVESVTEVLAPAVVPEPAPTNNRECRVRATQLIVRWEVTNKNYYDKRLIRPVWPQGASGVTWGIGYDGGHQRRSVIVSDWFKHEHRERLGDTAGITGTAARDVLPKFKDIQTEWDHALEVFSDRSLDQYERIAERSFKVGMRDLDPGVCAALVSLVYNRGGSMTGDSRREMRTIRDQCLPFDGSCVAVQIRSMCRLWKNTVNEKGLCARRDMEADYAAGVLQ